MKKVLYFVMSFILVFSSAHAQEPDAKMPDQILHYVNQTRAQYHLAPLKMLAPMSLEAQKHSQDMANHRMSFGHDGFMGRIKRIYAQFDNCQGGAENVAYNYKDAHHVVSQWMTSSGHKKNILGHYNYTGIGIARDAQGKIYFTQIFLRKG